MFSQAGTRFIASISRASGCLAASARPAACSSSLPELVQCVSGTTTAPATPSWLQRSPAQTWTPLSSPSSFYSSAAGPQQPQAPTSSSTPNPDTTTPSADSSAETSDPTPPTSPQPASGPASRRDKGAAADTIYPSSKDDNLGVQRNWFNALYSQLNVVHRTGMVPHMKGRQQEIFCAVEREFEGLWERHVRDKGLQGTAHRGMLLCCLAIATHKVLRYESGDDELVKEIVRTNLGGMAVGVMQHLHKARLWLLLKLLAEDPYKQAVRLLPSLQGDLGSLLDSGVQTGEAEATWTIRHCGFHEVLAAEDATELSPEFCCQYSMQWLEGFADYGVRVGLEQGKPFGDECCMVRISRRQTAPPPPTSAGAKPAGPEGQQAQQQPKEAESQQAPPS